MDSRSDADGRTDELLRLLLDSALEHAVFLLDRDGRITWWSKGAERVFALSREQAIGMPLTQIFTPTDRQSGLAQLEMAIADADAISEDDRWHVRADGGRFWASGALITLRGTDGKVLGFGKILRDRTDTKEQLVGIQSQLEDAQRSHMAKDSVIAKVAHELRNLFTGLNAGLQVMRSHSGDESRQKDVMTLMQQQLQVVRSLTEDLLDAHRSRAGKVSLVLEPVTLQQVLNDASEHLRSRAEAKSQLMQLLAPRAPIIVLADPSRIFQVFTNLIENAIKYTPAEGRIWVKASFDDRDAIVHVEDTGRGIAPAMLPRVFDMFTQADPASSDGGLGIGLALVNELVRLHGGSVQAVSLGLGKGSEFTVRLPLQDPRQAPTPVRE
ncbi:MAG TPA: HAMP domain-containing sensor histidine kinase [Steroidobacteraceae bacterium]|nr:HAMP domain-containing sensor histidine kinase [Steroidobacteraceae bacterium]